MIVFDFRYIELCIVKNGEIIWKNSDRPGLIIMGVCDLIFSIKDHLRFKHNLLIGRPAAERIFAEIASVLSVKPDRIYPVKGRNLISKLPETVMIESPEIREVCRFFATGAINHLKRGLRMSEYNFEPPAGMTVIGVMPPDLSSRVIEHPIILSGEYASLPGLKELLEQELQLEVIVQQIKEESSNNQ